MKRTKALIKQEYQFRETKGTIIADTIKGVEIAKTTLKKHRNQLEEYIRQNPYFSQSFEPIRVKNGPPIVRWMAQTSEKAGVGPMAAVAGAIADLTVYSMIQNGAKVAVVENGGEASANSNIPIDIALLAGDNPLSKLFGFRLEEFPIGVATSSGKFSHAFSYGDADAVTIFADNASLADAAATAVGNIIKGEDTAKAIEQGIHKACSITGVKGVMIIYEEKIGHAGNLPKLLRLKKNGKQQNEFQPIKNFYQERK